MMKRGVFCCLLLAVLTVALFALNLLVGSVRIPAADVVAILFGYPAADVSAAWQYIVLQSRLPQAMTAVLCGGALAVSGLLLQTAFRNPLAGPGIFGVNSGAGLGVALVMLLFGGSLSVGSLQLSGFVAVLAAAFIGAMAVIALIFFFSTLVRSNVMLLIVGIMIGYIANSAISLLNFFATDEGVKSYMVWGMGSFGGVSMANMPVALGRHHRLLRSCGLHRTGRAPHRPSAHRHRQPPHPDACHHSDGSRRRSDVQPRLLPSRRVGCHPAERRHAPHRRPRHHLRHREGAEMTTL